jgi:hypothetical protein
MTAAAQARFLSTAFGLVMVAAAVVQAHGIALVTAGVAAAAVLAGTVFRPAAPLAVLSTAAVIVIADAPPMLTALSGLSAAGYLVLRHTAAATAPTVVGAVGFTAVGLGAASLPMELPWVPVLAPLAVVVAYVLVTRPYWSEQGTRRGGATTHTAASVDSPRVSPPTPPDGRAR